MAASLSAPGHRIAQRLKPGGRHRGRPVQPGTSRAFFSGRDLGETLNDGIKVYVKLSIIAFVVGLVLFVVFALIFVLPVFNKTEKLGDQITHFPSSRFPFCQPGLPRC
ncbi:hypothetical protein [Amycolatopsis pigmentata]|uniref:Uncharacterized protein n=1 Tax=Amycolatopsis pigmentata TaxID=450801 RepID=A0ABW5FRT0_9PSEU